MSKVEIVRALVNQRLTAATEEIFGLFERTIAEYEEELCRSKEKNERQQKLLDAVLKPEVRLGLDREDVQQLGVSGEEVPPEQQTGAPLEWSPSLDQEDPPEPPHIKEEQEELWTSQEGEQLQGLEEADITKFLFTPVPVKSEDDEEKPQSSQLHQRQTEQMETGADGEDCGGPEPARNSHPDPHLQPETEDRIGNNHRRFSCLVCSETFFFRKQLRKHMITHPEGKPFSCSMCAKRFTLQVSLTSHMLVHTGEIRFSCKDCDKGFFWRHLLTKHKCVQSTQHLQNQTEQETGADGEDCGGPEPARNSHPDPYLQPETEDSKALLETQQTFNRMNNNEPLQFECYKQFSHLLRCSFCGKTFARNRNLKLHMAMHTGEKPFQCSVCGKRFPQKGNLTMHMAIHSAEKPFQCSVCGKGFTQKGNLKLHMAIHTGEKKFVCSVCGKTFIRKEDMTRHMVVHTGDKRYSCSICDRRFSRSHRLRGHKCVGPQSSQLHQTEQNREAEPGASSSTEQMQPAADGEDCGGPEPARNSHPDF